MVHVTPRRFDQRLTTQTGFQLKDVYLDLARNRSESHFDLGDERNKSQSGLTETGS